MIIQHKEDNEVFMWYSADSKGYVALGCNKTRTSHGTAEWYAAHANNRYLGPFELTRWET